ncbi:alkaline shock response membrane anchor protein AmaP [Actinophytocola glycyrrhizae]|uniref:Alkaline shock response membrane anchor protein AmaP n=1 Tax=Actinophytocola glycyrrhizae TaxID=2044873 RepID=A0ABV9S588_9PSEU
MNRVLLAVIGLVLLLAGVFAVVTNTGVLTVVDRGARLAPGTATPPTWVWYVVAAVGVVAALLALRWLLTQLTPATKTRTWQLEEDPEPGRTELSTSTATAPFVTDVTACPGVHTARAALAGPQESPRLAVVVDIEQDASVAAVREHIGTYALPRLRQALDLDTLPTAVEFRFTTKAGARVQ